ncbi:hypothetical protein K402DRAFT_323585 [Aulographum hederae CBS 113979]|uniref:Rhodopsin domain-containing protein n=1 Tax=Aulographum hederae CBS 113979 TaxID=1176131 RepID=A0A6G1HE27_9PEZI|nr:hypothetical protein K402DRAFT_323585 [Aulographum hederae CBS 113979]
MEDRGSDVLGVAIFFLVAAWITTSLRVYVRVKMLRSFGSDDYVMLLALAIFTAYISFQIGGVVHGTGKHMVDVPEGEAVKAFRYWWLAEIFYVLSAVVVKISLGLFLLRVAIKPAHIWTLRTVIIVESVFGIAYFLVLFFQCQPVSWFWTHVKSNPPPGSCMDGSSIGALTYAASVINSLADWVMGIIPVFIVRTIQTTRRQKILVGIILAVGAIGSTATIVRIPYIETFNNQADFLYATVDVALWSTIEPGIGMVAVNCATLRPLIQKGFQKVGLKSGKSVSTGTPHTNRYERKQRIHSTSNPYLSELDNFGGRGNENRTTTTITGGPLVNGHKKGSFGSSHSRDEEEASQKPGITKDVVFSYRKE